MRVLPMAALAAFVAAGAMPASAQQLKDIGRAIESQVLGARPDRDRDAYERGREDQARHEQLRREEWRHDREARGWDERRHRDRDWER
jgi:hypothetical protein